MNDRKLNEILARQAAAAEEKRLREANVKAAQDERIALREHTKELWKLKSKDLDDALEDLNARMSENDILLVKRIDVSGRRADAVETVIVKFDGNEYDSTLRKIRITIAADGIVKTSMGTQTQSPVKSPSFRLDEASQDTWFDILLDFVDINTP